MKKRVLLWSLGTLICGLLFVLWAQQSVANITLLGRINFIQKPGERNGIWTSSEQGTGGGSRGDLIRCSEQQECFALGYVDDKETVFTIPSQPGRHTRAVVLQKNSSEMSSQAFAVSRTGKYWWTANSGTIGRKPKSKELIVVPNTAKITAYRQDGKIQQQWQLKDSKIWMSRMEALGDDSLMVLSDLNLYRFQLGQATPIKYPHGELLNSSAAMGWDGFIWSPDKRGADNSISLVGASIFDSSGTKKIRVNYPSRKFWIDPFQSDRQGGLFVGHGGTLRHMRVDLLRPDGKVERIILVSNGGPVGFKPPREAYYLRQHLLAGKDYVLVATSNKDKRGVGDEHFILKITPVTRWKTWFSQNP